MDHPGADGVFRFPGYGDAIQPLVHAYYYPIGVAGGTRPTFTTGRTTCDGYFAAEERSGSQAARRCLSQVGSHRRQPALQHFFGGTQPTFPNSWRLTPQVTSTSQATFSLRVDRLPATITHKMAMCFPVTANALQTQNEACRWPLYRCSCRWPDPALFHTVWSNEHQIRLGAASGSGGWANGMAYVGGETYSDAFHNSGSVRPGCVTWGSYTTNRQGIARHIRLARRIQYATVGQNSLHMAPISADPRSLSPIRITWFMVSRR